MGLQGLVTFQENLQNTSGSLQSITKCMEIVIKLRESCLTVNEK